MTNAIAVLYDFSTQENMDYFINIITTLADRGVAFDISQNAEKNVCLVVNGSIYSPKQIGDCEEDVLKHVMRTDQMMRNRESELVDVVSQ